MQRFFLHIVSKLNLKTAFSKGSRNKLTTATSDDMVVLEGINIPNHFKLPITQLTCKMSYGGRSNYGGGRSYGGGGRGFGGDRGFGGPKPVETGKEYDVQISEISRQGDGIARVQGFVIFVKGGKVGQKAKVRITNVGARFATAEVVSEGQQQAAGSTGTQTQQSQQTQTSTSSTSTADEKQKDVAPQVEEEEKPTLQDYKSGTGSQGST